MSQSIDIEQFLEKLDGTWIFNQLLGELTEYADQGYPVESIVVYEIAKDKLIKILESQEVMDKKEGYVVGSGEERSDCVDVGYISPSGDLESDSIKEKGRTEYGNWLKLEKLIGSKDMKIEKQFLEDEYRQDRDELLECDDCINGKCDHHIICHCMLYCEGLYIHSFTGHTNAE